VWARSRSTPARSTPSLHDALPISRKVHSPNTALVDLESSPAAYGGFCDVLGRNTVVDRVKKNPSPRSGRDKLTNSRATIRPFRQDRKSTRLNSSHVQISYAVFCVK